jgi:predicted N-acetyltransferase YhbS
MKLVNWARFSWDLTKLAPVYPAIDSRYRLRLATAEDETAVRNVVFSAFTLDSNWTFLLRDIRERLEDSIAGVFHDKYDKHDRGERPCMVATHGTRVIGASALTANPDAENHLLTGPCVLMEYRNRGLATALLAESLIALRDANLTVARGITKQNSPASQFVYPKFSSTNEPFEREPRLAAS